MEGVVLLDKIPRNINDVSQKMIMSLFKDKKFSLFDVEVPQLVESLNVELQDVKVEERRSDLVFLLENEMILHLEFQASYRKIDVARFILYDVLLHKEHKQRDVTTVIIYSAGVKRKKVELKFETLTYQPHVIFLEEKNGDEILQKIEEKILNKKPLKSEDIFYKKIQQKVWIYTTTRSVNSCNFTHFYGFLIRSQEKLFFIDKARSPVDLALYFASY